MNPKSYINKTYRIQITDPEIEYFVCLPSTNQNHTETTIPKNSIVKIVDFHCFFNTILFEIEYNSRLYFVTESQIKDFFVPIYIRTNLTTNRRKIF